MSASPDVIHPQDVIEIGQGWKGVPLIRKDSGKGSSCTRLMSGDASSSGDECNTKVRKPYTITKQRERWTESEHVKFLEALKLYGRAWRKIEEYIGTKTAVQIRSHAQKFFSKLEREASTGSSAGKVQDIEIPPPRPKRKPSHPYPKKAGNSALNFEEETKELSASSTPDCSEVHPHQGFQPGSFTPYINKGLGASSVAFQRNPFVPGHFFGPQGSVKLFGKTVVVPKHFKPALHNDSSTFEGKSPVPSTQTNRADLHQTSGFGPFSKERERANVSERPLVSDRSGSCIVINPSERPGELHPRNCGDSIPATYESGAVDSHCINEGKDRQQRGRVEVRNIQHPCPLPQTDGVNLNLLFPHGVQQNQPVHHWLSNFFGYTSGLALPPMAGHGHADGVPNNPLTYWQFMQASAVNYAAYAAAVAAAAAAGWSGSISGHEEAAETSRADVNEAKSLLPLGNDVNPTALPSAATSWWQHRGFVPLGYSPMKTVHQGEQLDAAAKVRPYENEDLDLENASSQAEHVMDLGIAEEAETSDCEEDDENLEAEKSHPTNSGCTLGTLCSNETPVPESVLPGSDCQQDMDATTMQVICSTQQSDSERRIESPENLYSSLDEFDGQVKNKKQREGSSSGSNTPISRFQSSEGETLGMLEIKKKDSYTVFEDNVDTCSDAFKKSQQPYDKATTEAPKVIPKHSDRGRKYQQKECRHGGSDDSKRFKSCAHESDIRKEVSEEGRRAFRALFSSKLLPQTFAAASMVDERNGYTGNEHVSRPTVFRKESDPVYVPVPMDVARGECIHPDRSPQGDTVGKADAYGKLAMSNTCDNLEMGSGCAAMKGQHEQNNKSFAVSPSSGFVPYKRPLCTEARIPEQLSSF